MNINLFKKISSSKSGYTIFNLLLDFFFTRYLKEHLELTTNTQPFSLQERYAVFCLDVSFIVLKVELCCHTT